MLTLIHNPVAGRGRAAAALPAVRAILDGSQVPYNVLTTHHPGHASKLVAALPQDATVIAMGGDGTVHEVATPCIGTARTLGVIPVGSGDDFAFALGIHRRDLSAAVQRVVTGTVHLSDTGTVNGVPFVNAAGIGFDADVARRVRDAPAGLRGPAAYMYGVLSALAGLRSNPVEVTVDGTCVYRGRSLLISTQIGTRTGGSFLFAPAARVDDGLFEVVIAGNLGRYGTLQLLPKVMRGSHLADPHVLIVRGQTIRLRWDTPQPGHADGEPLAATDLIELKSRPASLRVLY